MVLQVLVLSLGTFLCRPLQNNKVKWLSSTYFGEREPERLIFRIAFCNWTLSVDIYPMQIFRLIGALNRFTELRHSKVKYKFISYNASSPPSPSSLLKLPITQYGPRTPPKGRGSCPLPSYQGSIFRLGRSSSVTWFDRLWYVTEINWLWRPVKKPYGNYNSLVLSPTELVSSRKTIK